MNKTLIQLFTVALLLAGCNSQNSATVENDFTFNGYTNHWQGMYENQFRYGNLYKLNVPDLAKNIAQFKIDIAEELGLSGLQMEEGFINGLLSHDFTPIDISSKAEINNAESDNLLAFIDKSTDYGKELIKAAPKVPSVGSYQRNTRTFDAIDAFTFKDGGKTIYAVVGDKDRLQKVKEMINTASEVLASYDLKRGWFGIGTHTMTVTCSPSNQLDAISKGMNEGNSWFVFDGSFEYISQATTPGVLDEINSPIVVDFGSSPVYGTEDYSNLQVQLMFGKKEWREYKEANGGYFAENMPSEITENTDSCDFYLVNPGQAKALNSSKKPFAARTGEVIGGTKDCMVLFTKKGEPFNRQKMWEAIMDRREVAICGGNCFIGDDQYRQTLQLLVLDRVFLEELFGDRVNLTATVVNDNLHITATNYYNHKVKCNFALTLPSQIESESGMEQNISLAAGKTTEVVFKLKPTLSAMGRRNAVLIKADWCSGSKMLIADAELPPALSTHQLLYGAANSCKFPVSVHNITSDAQVEVSLAVEQNGKTVYEDKKTLDVEKGQYATSDFELKLPEGSYVVKTSAMGAETSTQLGISSGKGKVTLKEVDLNGDGMNEYVMENDKVRVTLLRIGARAMELYVKDRDDNAFFKLWPENPVDVNRPYRDRGFWPYGGFEDFLGQGSAETHKVYEAEVIKDGGDYAQVKMTADLYGNIIEKTYTLYGDTPFLEARFALDFINPEMDILGPQPILAIGKKHWTEDQFYIPCENGLEHRVMDPDKYYGSMFYPVEGWFSGYDTAEDITFIGAYPVNRPMFLHMWMNHPRNPDTHYYYAEFQPWLTIEQGVTSYFSFYMWASSGNWNTNLQKMKDLNLISTKK